MNLELANGFEGLVRDALQWMMDSWNRGFDVAEKKDGHRFLLLCLSVPFSHCASATRSCLAPKELFPMVHSVDVGPFGPLAIAR